jgi:hypothetical protein
VFWDLSGGLGAVRRPRVCQVGARGVATDDVVVNPSFVDLTVSEGDQRA